MESLQITVTLAKPRHVTSSNWTLNDWTQHRHPSAMISHAHHIFPRDDDDDDDDVRWFHVRLKAV